MKITGLIKVFYPLLFIIVFGCKRELKKFGVYNSLNLPSTELEIKRKVDSLKSIDKAGRVPIKNYGATNGFIKYHQFKPYIIALFPKGETNVVTAYKLFFIDPIDEIEYQEESGLNLTYETVDKLFPGYYVSGTSVISHSLLSTIISDLNIKYGQYKQDKDMEKVYSRWQGKTLEIERVFYRWSKEDLLVNLRVKTDPIFNGIQIMLEYELSSDYLKENKELLDELKSKQTNF